MFLERSLFAFLMVNVLHVTVVCEDYCKEESYPETVFTIGENVYINSNDKKLWLLKRDKTQVSVFTEVNIEQTFNNKFSRISHTIDFDPKTYCLDGSECTKLRSLVIVIGRDKQNSSICYPFKRESEGKLVNASEADLPKDWGLRLDGGFGTNTSHFWDFINSAVNFIDLFYDSNTVFLRFSQEDNQLFYKKINSSGMIDRQWKKSSVVGSKIYNGWSGFHYDQQLYEINGSKIYCKFQVVITESQIAVRDFNDFKEIDNKQFFGCFSKPNDSTTDSVNTELPESTDSSEDSATVNHSDSSEVTESPGNSTKPKSNITIIIIVVIVILVVVIIIIILCLFCKPKNKKRAANVNSSAKPKIPETSVVKPNDQSDTQTVGSKKSSAPELSENLPRSPSSVSQRSQISGKSNN